jgi:hypothetical protein
MAIGCMPGNKDNTVQKPNENEKREGRDLPNDDPVVW